MDWTAIVTVSYYLFAAAAAWAMSWFLFRCRHNWQLVDKTELPPQIIIYKETGGVQLHFGYMPDHRIHDMCKRTVILVLRCDKCGQAKIVKERG